jgi:hypothetical protein
MCPTAARQGVRRAKFMDVFGRWCRRREANIRRGFEEGGILTSAGQAYAADY